MFASKSQEFPTQHRWIKGLKDRKPPCIVKTESPDEPHGGPTPCLRAKRSHARHQTRQVNMLNTQYRMHPAISRFPSQHFYERRWDRTREHATRVPGKSTGAARCSRAWNCWLLGMCSQLVSIAIWYCLIFCRCGKDHQHVFSAGFFQP